MKAKFILLLSIIGILFPNEFISAGGNDFRTMFGARTLALDGLYFAGSDGLSCSMANPAGLAFMGGREIQAGVIDKLGMQQFDSPKLGLYRSQREDDLSFGGGAYWNFNSSLTAAVSYGRVLDYSTSWPFAMLGSDNATILTFDMYNKFHVDAIAPTIALNLGRLAIGLTVDIYRVEQSAAYPQGNGQEAAGYGLYAYQFNIEQKAWAYGFSLGAIEDLSDNLRAGVTIKSGYKANLSGNATGKMFADVDSSALQSDISSTFQMPWNIGAGIIYQASPGLKINVDMGYSLWKGIQSSIDTKYSNATWQSGLSHVDSLTGIQGTSLPLSYKNTFEIGAGIEYAAEDGIILRAGYRFSQMPNTDATYSFLMPGVNEHSLSVGVGLKGDGYVIDAGLVYSYGPSKSVTKTLYPQFSGSYSSDSYIPSITIRYSF